MKTKPKTLSMLREVHSRVTADRKDLCELALNMSKRYAQLDMIIYKAVTERLR